MTFRQRRLQERQSQWLAKTMLEDYNSADVNEDYHGGEHKDVCHYCGGDGYGIVGTDWDSDDPINGPYDGETEVCPCCHGSGLAEDCVFW